MLYDFNCFILDVVMYLDYKCWRQVSNLHLRQSNCCICYRCPVQLDDTNVYHLMYGYSSCSKSHSRDNRGTCHRIEERIVIVKIDTSVKS